MDNYDLLLNEIKNFLAQDEIKEEDTNVEIISLYDLYCIVNEELKDLRDIMNNSKLNNKYKKTRFMNLIIGINTYSETKIMFDNRACISLYKERFDDSKPGWCVEEYLYVYKEKNIDRLHLSDEKCKENKCFYNFIKRNYNLILDTLTKLEYYIDLLGKIYDKCKFSNYGLFNIGISFNDEGKVDIKLDIKQGHPLYDEYYKNWYNRENIHVFAKKHQDEILKRLPISVYELTGNFKVLYEEHMRKKEEAPKVKVKR